MNLQSLNLLAIIVAGLAYFFLGALWYSPVLFAKTFIKYRGMTAEQIQAQGGQPLDYLLTLIAEVLSAFVLAIFVQFAGATTLVDGAAVGLVAALGLSATTAFVYTIFSGPHRMLWVLNTGYTTLAFVIMGVILALWR